MNVDEIMKIFASAFPSILEEQNELTYYRAIGFCEAIEKTATDTEVRCWALRQLSALYREESRRISEHIEEFNKKYNIQ